MSGRDETITVYSWNRKSKPFEVQVWSDSETCERTYGSFEDALFGILRFCDDLERIYSVEYGGNSEVSRDRKEMIERPVEMHNRMVRLLEYSSS